MTHEDPRSASPRRARTRAGSRVGRGIGGKGGKTAGRGTKGQGARDTVPIELRRRPDAAAHARAEAEGLQEPVPGRVPGASTSTSSRRPGSTRSTPATLHAKGLVHKGALVKVLGRGEITRTVTVKAHAFSKSAEAAITAAGGSVEVLPLPWGDRRPPAKGNQHTNR